MKGNKLLEVIRNRLRRATFRLRTLPEPPEGLTAALLVAATASFLSLGIVLRAGSAPPSGPARATRARTRLLAVLVAVLLALTLAPLPASASALRSIGLAGIAVYLVAGILSSSPRFSPASGRQRPP